MTKRVMATGKEKEMTHWQNKAFSHAGSLIQKHYYSCRVHKTALMRSNMIKHKSKPHFSRRCTCFSLVIPGIFFSETQLLTVNAHTLAAKLSK